MKRFKLSKKRKNDSVCFLKKMLTSKTVSKEEKTEIRKLIEVKQKRNSELADKIIHSKTSELAYTLLKNLGAGETVKMGSHDLTNYDAKEVLQIMLSIIRTANDKQINIME